MQYQKFLHHNVTLAGQGNDTPKRSIAQIYPTYSYPSNGPKRGDVGARIARIISVSPTNIAGIYSRSPGTLSLYITIPPYGVVSNSVSNKLYCLNSSAKALRSSINAFRKCCA